MNRITNPSPRTAALGAGIVAAASAVLGVTQLAHEDSGATTVVGSVEHIAITAFSVLLLGTVPVVMFMARRIGVSLPAAFAVTGAVVLAALATISNVRGEDASFFAAVAVPANLAILGGWTALAVSGYRSGNVPKLVAVGLPLSQIAAIPLSQVGGGLLTSAYFIYVAVWALRADQPAGMPAVAPATA